MMPRSLHIIGNVQMDVLARPVTRLPQPGGDEIIDHIAVRPAGAAGNVSLALAALDIPHRLFGAVGDDQAGRWVAQELHSLGVGDDLQIVPGGETGISIALEAPGRERAFLTAHGVLTDYNTTLVPPHAVDAELVLLTGYFSLPGLRGAGTRQLVQAAHEKGARTFFDTGWDPENWTGTGVAEVLDLLPLVDVFLPNQPEAAALSGKTDPEQALAFLLQQCPGWVIVKLGEQGVLAGGPQGQLIHVPAPHVIPLDTTGAGDSLAAGLLADLALDKDMPTALATGVRVASTVVARPSENRYPTREDISVLDVPQANVTRLEA